MWVLHVSCVNGRLVYLSLFYVFLCFPWPLICSARTPSQDCETDGCLIRLGSLGRYPQCSGSVVYYTWRVGICVWAPVFGCAHAGIRVRLPLTADGDGKGGVATQQGRKHIHEKHVNAGLGEQILERP